MFTEMKKGNDNYNRAAPFTFRYAFNMINLSHELKGNLGGF